MAQNSYSYRRKGFERYIFTSIGKSQIVKLVDFSATQTLNLYNLGFGDLLPDGTIDDKVNSNNGDIIKVLATVAQIVRDFTRQFPEIKIIFVGTTKERNRLYARILKMYYEEFREEFIITVLVGSPGTLNEIDFDPRNDHTYFGFFVKRIN
jgi:hypothetical protein